MEKLLFRSTGKTFVTKFTKKVQEWKGKNIPVLVLYLITRCYQQTESKSYQKKEPKNRFISIKSLE